MNLMSEDYRRANTSSSWVGEALALRLMHAEAAWDHDAFFDYVDRWMFEDDTAFRHEILASHPNYGGAADKATFAHQGRAWDGWVDALFKKYRPTLAAPFDGWKTQHDDSYYRQAVGLPATP